MLLDGGINPVRISIVGTGWVRFVGWGGWWVWCGDVCQMLVCGSDGRDKVGEAGDEAINGSDEYIHGFGVGW